jgi:hypothetical protein
MAGGAELDQLSHELERPPAEVADYPVDPT